MIECKLRDMPDTKGSEVKKGRYHGSNFWDVEGFAKRVWMVGAYIDLCIDDEECVGIPPAKTHKEIAEGCIEYLNQPPERKKYEKKQHDSPYGKLSLYQYTFKKDPNGRDYIQVILSTTDRKNKNFWGKGKSDKF